MRTDHTRLATWHAAMRDRYAWAYLLEEHYAHLRDRANQLFQSGAISLEQRNEMAMAAFEKYLSTHQRNELALTSYQQHYYYQVLESDQLIGVIDWNGLLVDTTESRLGAVADHYGADAEFQLVTYVDYQKVVIGVIHGLDVRRPDGPPWQLRHMVPEGFRPKRWREHETPAGVA